LSRIINVSYRVSQGRRCEVGQIADAERFVCHVFLFGITAVARHFHVARVAGHGFGQLVLKTQLCHVAGRSFAQAMHRISRQPGFANTAPEPQAEAVNRERRIFVRKD
jgi:hypothetical protein